MASLNSLNFYYWGEYEILQNVVKRCLSGITGVDDNLIDRQICLFMALTTFLCSLLWIVLLCQKFCNEYLCPLRPASASSLLLDCEDLSVHYRLSYISDFLVIKRIDDCSKHATNLGPSTTTGMAEVEKEEPKSEDECACAICLEEYHAGDEVCWSRSPKCRHVYHRACAEQWLLYDDKCPCCRNSYLEPSHDGDNNADKQYVPPLERNETNPRPYYHHQSLMYARGVVTTSEEVPPWIMFF